MKSLIFLSLILSLSSCSSQTPVYTSPTGNVKITDRSVVSIIEPVVIEDLVGVPIGTGYSSVCNAFCAQDIDEPYLITAAHCLPGAGPGSRFQYLSPDGIGAKWATVEYVAPVGDLVIASVNDSNLVPLNINASYYPNVGDVAISISSVADSVSKGKVIGELTHGWFDTTQTIDFGWSGSPVLNEYGLAWGIVSMCRLDEGESVCEPDYAIINSIY